MLKSNDKCEHCGVSMDEYAYCSECWEAACESCMEHESDCAIAVRRRLEEVEAFLLDPDDISLDDLRNLAADHLRRKLQRKGKWDIDENLLLATVVGGTVAELKTDAREMALVEQPELRDRLRVLEQETQELAAAGLVPSGSDESGRRETE